MFSSSESTYNMKDPVEILQLCIYLHVFDNSENLNTKYYLAMTDIWTICYLIRLNAWETKAEKTCQFSLAKYVKQTFGTFRKGIHVLHYRKHLLRLNLQPHPTVALHSTVSYSTTFIICGVLNFYVVKFRYQTFLPRAFYLVLALQ